ncbi:Ash family protein [Haemophilus sp. HMSC061E01]|nr:Ash family protein [Haemophilus sp. HMSC061E01]
MNLNHIYCKQYEIFFKLFLIEIALQTTVKFGIMNTQSEKVIASREKLNYLLANDSTPQNRAFFVRNIRTPKEYADFALHINPIILSMVERNGQPLAVGCFPVKAVSHPVTFYRPTVRSLAVDSEKILLESTQMYQFIFAAIRRTDLSNHLQKIRITADSERNARAKLAREFVLVLAGRINLQNASALSANTFPSISFAEVDHA